MPVHAHGWQHAGAPAWSLSTRTLGARPAAGALLRLMRWNGRVMRDPEVGSGSGGDCCGSEGSGAHGTIGAACEASPRAAGERAGREPTIAFTPGLATVLCSGTTAVRLPGIGSYRNISAINLEGRHTSMFVPPVRPSRRLGRPRPIPAVPEQGAGQGYASAVVAGRPDIRRRRSAGGRLFGHVPAASYRRRCRIRPGCGTGPAGRPRCRRTGAPARAAGSRLPKVTTLGAPPAGAGCAAVSRRSGAHVSGRLIVADKIAPAAGPPQGSRLHAGPASELCGIRTAERRDRAKTVRLRRPS